MLSCCEAVSSYPVADAYPECSVQFRQRNRNAHQGEGQPLAPALGRDGLSVHTDACNFAVKAVLPFLPPSHCSKSSLNWLKGTVLQIPSSIQIRALAMRKLECPSHQHQFGVLPQHRAKDYLPLSSSSVHFLPCLPACLPAFVINESMTLLSGTPLVLPKSFPRFGTVIILVIA